jgi:predicted transcriptional regulator
MMLSNLRREIGLLERHVTVLDLVLKNGPVGIIKLSAMSGLPQHKVRYSLRVLEHKGLINPSQKGAVATKKAEGYKEKLYTDGVSIREEFEALLEGMR